MHLSSSWFEVVHEDEVEEEAEEEAEEVAVEVLEEEWCVGTKGSCLGGKCSKVNLFTTGACVSLQ